jgi:hypothetical protein
LLSLDGSQRTVSALERANKGDGKKIRTAYEIKQGKSEIRKFLNRCYPVLENYVKNSSGLFSLTH